MLLPIVFISKIRKQDQTESTKKRVEKHTRGALNIVIIKLEYYINNS